MRNWEHRVKMKMLCRLSVCVITLLFCSCCGTSSRPQTFLHFPSLVNFNDEKCLQLEMTKQCHSCPRICSSSLEHDTFGVRCMRPRCFCDNKTKTLYQLLRYGAKTLKQRVHQIPNFPSVLLRFWRHVSEMWFRVARLFPLSERVPCSNQIPLLFFWRLNNGTDLCLGYFQ